MAMQPHLFIQRSLRAVAPALCAAVPLLAVAQPQPPQRPAVPRLQAASAVKAVPPQPALPFKLRVVGGLAGITQYTQLEAPFWSQELSRLSGGRFSADIVPFDRAGVPGMEMLRLLQLGVVPFGTTLMSSLSAQYPQYTAADLPGLNPSIGALRTTVTAFRPYLEKALRDEHGIEPLAIYTYPAQVVFCKRPMARLSDLAGRRIRVSSAAQADFITAVGGIPVLTSFAQMRGSLESQESECAVTGSMSGNTVGLHTMTSHLYPMPLTWGLAIFGANQAAWQALPADLRTLLKAELPKLEAAIWDSADRETADGIACSTGQPECRAGSRGSMTLVPVSAQDERRRKELFASTVLPRWLRRCTVRCADVWTRTIGPVHGIPAPPQP